MEPHHVPFGAIERTRLQQDAIRDMQLADVVEHRGPADAGRRLRFQPRRAG
jgi:hypothetical protein